MDYKVKVDGRCIACGYLKTDLRHFQTHVPPSRWPDELRGAPHPPRVVVNGLVYDADKVPEPHLTGPTTCDDCGWVVRPDSKNPASSLRCTSRRALPV